MPDDYVVGSSAALPAAPTPDDLLSGPHPHQRLSSLRPPPPYSVHVSNLTIIAPVPPVTIPLAVPIPIPGFISRRLGPRSRGADPPRELVRSANLQVEPGEVLAIAGGSGSGKTTLLNAIAGRLGNLDTTGSVSFARVRCGDNNSPTLDPNGSHGVGIGEGKQIRKIVGFVRQDDFLLPYLTVRETLLFAASLRLPRSVSQADKEAIVDQTIVELGLGDAADVIVGGPFRKGISGGEKRRLTIGCILVTLPSVLVLDEPTTGLDSFTAYQLLQTLSSDAFTLFDKVTLLSSGSVVYSGFTSGILQHFRAQGFSPEANTNPLDFVVDVSSIDTRSDAAEDRTRTQVGKLTLAWREHELSSGQALWTAYTKESTVAPAFGDLDRVTSSGADLKNSDDGEARANLASQISLLTRRSFLNVTRNYPQSLGFLVQFVVIGVVMGLAFLMPPETPAGIQSLKTVVYQSTPAAFYLSIIVACWIQCAELTIFDREREDNLYSVVPYALGSWLSYLPGNVVFPAIYAIIIYFMCGFRRDNIGVNLLSFIAQCILQQLCAWGYALLAASISRSFAQASLLANGFSIPFILSSGYLIVDLPVWISWTRWISPYYYGFHWIGRLQFIGRNFACVGVTGPARNACVGQNVLVGLKFPINTPIYVYPLGLLGFVIVTQGIATLLLRYYHPGGVKHALSPESTSASTSVPFEEKEKPRVGSDHGLLKDRVDVAVERLELTVRRRGFLKRGPPVSKVILAQVDAFFPAGEVSVIMGPSGAGKSSLLQLLAGRLHSGRGSDFNTNGAILLNGRRLDASTSGLVAFVEQEDAHHLPALTVRETLQYAARLRLRGKSTAECEARAEEVLRMLGLKLCADNIVGGELVKGISGGEKRRLSLGVQLISDPSVLLADEPLSGLDAFTAQNVMQSLKAIASSGRTVIVSVHQPRSDIWNMFDNVLLLAKGGRSAYSGPRTEILKAFQSAGLECPQDFNAADFLLDAISIDRRSEAAEAKSQDRVSQILDVYKRSSVTHARKSREVFTKAGGESKLTSAPFLVAFPVVLGRSFKNLRRQQDAFVARLANAPFLGLLFWLFFARLNLGPAGAQNRIGVLQETTALPFVGMLSCIAIFPTEKALFFHEWKSSGRHSVEAFAVAYFVQEAAVAVLSSGLLSIIMVFGINLQHTPRIFLEFWFSVWCLLSVGESIGIVFATFFENGGLAVSLVSAGITLMAQLNGIISVTLPYWLQVIGWATPMKSQSYIGIINEMTGLVFECSAAQIESGVCIAATGNQLLETFGITNQSTGKLVGILAALILLFRLFAVLALKIRVRSL